MSAFDDISPTFCALPWIHLASNPNGTAKMCCIAKTDLKHTNSELYSFEKNSIKEIWNSSPMKEAREKMLKGERISDCAQCYSEEALGSHSMRIGFNDKWHNQQKDAVYARVQESKENNYNLISMPWYYDLRQGNLCNLKCRSCAPENSVTIENEYVRLADTNDWFRENFGKPQLSESYRNWFNSDFFNNQLLQEIPNIKKLYFTGGEPTLIERNYLLLQKCVDLGYAKNIELMFNTNLTNLNDRFLNLIKQFRHVMLNLSIEGFGTEQEYLRGNSKWNMIAGNLEKLASNAVPNIHLLLTPVIQACNVLTINKLFNYIETLNEKYQKNIFYFMPILLTEPKYLEMSILPKATREEAAKTLAQYITNSKIISYDRFFEPRLQQIISKLKEETEPDPKLVNKFINFTKTLDKNRNQDFRSTFPDLYNSWSQNSMDFKWN